MVRDLADRYVRELAELNPVAGTALGLGEHVDALPDLSPAGAEELAELQRRILRRLDRLALSSPQAPLGRPAPPGRPAPLGRLAPLGRPSAPDRPPPPKRPASAHGTAPAAAAAAAAAAERRCTTLLRERLSAELACFEAGDHLRSVSTLFSPLQALRNSLLLMPAATDEDWATIARRLARLPQAFEEHTVTLRAGLRSGLPAGPTQVAAVAEQLAQWLSDHDGAGWFAGFAARAPAAVRTDVARAAEAATTGTVRLHHFLTTEYLPAVSGAADAVGRERYARAARYWTGATLDLDDAYAWGWDELGRLRREMAAAATEVRPGAEIAEAIAHLEREGEAIDGVEQVREWLQRLMDETIADLDGRHLDLPSPVRRVEAMIAPAGSAAAPYYTRPSLDFARPGRTWLPTMGRTRFPAWSLVTTWYHEGVPGHHLQLGTWAHRASELSMFQCSVGSVSATTEGWALYAERLMAELGYFADPGRRLGYLAAQALRAARVVIDIGLHLELPVPADAAAGTGLRCLTDADRWHPDLARQVLAEVTGEPAPVVDSEVVRYLGLPAQAVTYKLGERAWLAGRDAARQAAGGQLDLRRWHNAALALGSLGLDDLAGELAELP